MSTITKEWLQQKIAEMESVRDEIPFSLDEDDSNTLAAMKLALASLEAERVGCDACGGNGSVGIDHGEMGIEHIECPKCYTTPPAPVSVPDELAGKSFNYIANKFQVSTSEAQWILVGWNARGAAMLNQEKSNG